MHEYTQRGKEDLGHRGEAIEVSKMMVEGGAWLMVAQRA
jgi:hypothetical protein